MNTIKNVEPEKVKKPRKKHVLAFVLVVALVLGSLTLAHASETPLYDEAPGTIITFSDKQWIVLEQMPNGETYILLDGRDGQRAFDPDNTQLFNPSDSNNIAYYLNNSFYNGLSQKDLIAEHTWDRVSVNSSDRKDGPDMGDVTCKVGLLSYREYEKYSTYYNGTILPSSYDYWWWTRTPRSEYSNYVWYVYSGGYLNSRTASGSVGSVRPALYLKSGILIDENKVVVGGGSVNRPVPPAGLSASAESSSTVSLSWQTNTEEDLAGYKVYRDNTQIADVGKTYTVYTDNAVHPGITYIYQVTAYNTSGRESTKSPPVTITTPPGTPAGVTAQATGKEVELSWQASGNPLFVVERSTDGTNFTQIAEVTETSFTEIVSLWDATYYYRVAQKGEDGQMSDFSAPAQITIEQEAVPVPNNLTAVLDGNTVALSWNAVQGIERYIVERSTDKTTWDEIGSSATNSYQDQIEDPEMTYYFRVRSDGGDGKYSEPSLVVEASLPIPTKPRITYKISNTDVNVSWDPQDCDGYKVYMDGTLVAEKTKDETSYSFTGERGETYRVEIEAFNEFGTASTSVNITISHMPTPGAGTMAGDIIKYAGAATASMGGLLALGFALQSSGGLMGLFKLLFRR